MLGCGWLRYCSQFNGVVSFAIELYGWRGWYAGGVDWLRGPWALIVCACVTGDSASRMSNVPLNIHSPRNGGQYDQMADIVAEEDPTASREINHNIPKDPYQRQREQCPAIEAATQTATKAVEAAGMALPYPSSREPQANPSRVVIQRVRCEDADLGGETL